MPALDFLLTGAEIVDGTGAPARRADIGLRGDRIDFVGLSADARAITTVDCTGMVLTPGLIDPHSHSDWSALGNPDAFSTIHQGVTTEVVGNCGVTYAPIGAYEVGATRGALQAMGYDGPVDWRSFGEYAARVHAGPTAQNLMWFVGHTAIRSAAQGFSDEPGQQVRLLEEAMDAGAIGFSSGLEYGSGRFASTEELVTLASVVGRRDGMYASHIRNRDAGLDTAVDEFFAVVAGGGVRAQLSHLNVRHDTGAESGAWERAAERVVAERGCGTDVLADMTPYPHGIGMATGLLPAWLAERPGAEAADLLKDRDIREQVRRDSDRYWRFVHRGQWDRVRLGVSPTHPDWEGLSFTEIAEKHGADEWECLFDILTAAGPDIGSVQLLGELFTPDHLAEAIAHDHFLLGVDAFTTCRHGALDGRTRDPLFYHGHTHYLAHHVPAGTLSLESAIHKMTGMVAEHFGMSGRGELRQGAFADIVAFDPAILQRTDTWSLPRRYADAARHVWVNGTPVITDATHTGRRPGLMLTHRP
ncbi:N-acyl-D-amino-acid deacylase [Mycolicibacterium peregrinum]|uniref:N-acyl-D-amino-acid deacylase n=1 Tax=Mycolicibacterium peregrinum TaxID=43304 RepID=A0A1A0RCT0_MYCPR|nr:amidohydrolase family protein [Mycolicibacterium peregrinum]OBB32300.1 N-acyl-D-amino-acid deacylase [Mycolicibacterium peregrinum]